MNFYYIALTFLPFLQMYIQYWVSWSLPPCHCLDPAAKAFLCPFSFLFQIQVYLKTMHLHYRSILHHTTIQYWVFSCVSLLSDCSLKISYTSETITMSPFQYRGIPCWVQSQNKSFNFKYVLTVPTKTNYHKYKFICRGNRLKKKAHWGFLTWLLHFWEFARPPFCYSKE